MNIYKMQYYSLESKYSPESELLWWRFVCSQSTYFFLSFSLVSIYFIFAASTLINLVILFF